MFNAITLELSLKPFKQTDEPYIRNVCREILAEWRPLIKNRNEISFLFWTGDGSEILDYDGDEKKEFEWGYFIGTANLPLATEKDDPALSLHAKKRLYTENPPKMTYETLKSIVRTFKEEGQRLFPDAKIRAGSIFDVGPEFAISDFKYKRHPEICSGTALDKLRFVDSTALLHADNRAYAAYPDGIPEGLSFATFLGAQTKAFFSDIGFDYIWFSNGLGYSADPWKLTGKIYDGEHFYAEKLEITAEKVFSFWKMFRAACPNLPIESRGTNNSAGIDYATDGVPLWDVYNAGFNVLPPPNSPWAALNNNYGLEITGHMTRICHLPGKDFLFRYYLNDPWWMNSPWYDRYDGCASDIYLPMSIARIDESGNVQSASRLNVFTLDNSRGDIPDQCVNEALPHILKAEKDCPDEIPFLIWLYPMKKYTTAKSERDLFEMYHGDKFIMEAINNGLPLNTVISAEIFKNLPTEIYTDRIIVSPCVCDDATTERLAGFAASGGKLLIYGSSERISENRINGKNVIKIDIKSEPSALREKLSSFCYDIRFETKEDNVKLPTMAISRSDNATFFSVYNANTTTDTLLKFPLGAPVLLGCETQIENGYAKYRFSRCEHRECRVFVNQNDGVISAHEAAPVSEKYRRRFFISGLKDATVYYFPEKYCDKFIAATKNDADKTPELDEAWEPICDDIMGHGFVGRHKNGRIYFLMPLEKYL